MTAAGFHSIRNDTYHLGQLNGRALAQTLVALDDNAITAP